MNPVSHVPQPPFALSLSKRFIAFLSEDGFPIKLVWSQEFGTRMEALEAERQIKGWGRAKKLALIREDWSLISTLARSKEEK
ncbi:hypothetical protein TomMM35A_09840 [Sphingobium sp. TomMM35A]